MANNSDCSLAVRQTASCCVGILALFVVMVFAWNIRKEIWNSQPNKTVMTIVDVITSVVLLVCFVASLVLASFIDRLEKNERSFFW